ncbi:transcriptional regulator, TetR family [Desulfuromusa kysingii]|uniref:Transcriptional regulator, TetR family n=1 Tax=Desulfuromusa kysingii TaxID=37625 RepID=A0A1H3YCL3_9BACT|nr:TetR/AcrR family transcriptional regulator [Desulfuromusa kysingii]SEA08668.1 transcriptional regulator, TetR family [Desulfuromusa kysingii]
MKEVSRKKKLLDQMLRDEIVDVVLDLIKRDQPVTMDEVAKGCGVAKGTLYNYFENKDDLIAHVHQVVLIPLLESNERVLMGNGKPIARLHDFVDRAYSVHDEVCIYFQFVRRKKSAEDVLLEKIELILHPLANLCREGIESGEFIAIDPYVMAEMLFGTIIGPLTTLSYRTEVDHDLQRMKTDVKALIDRVVILKQQEKL